MQFLDIHVISASVINVCLSLREEGERRRVVNVLRDHCYSLRVEYKDSLIFQDPLYNLQSGEKKAQGSRFPRYFHMTGEQKKESRRGIRFDLRQLSFALKMQVRFAWLVRIYLSRPRVRVRLKCHASASRVYAEEFAR